MVDLLDEYSMISKEVDIQLKYMDQTEINIERYSSSNSRKRRAKV